MNNFQKKKLREVYHNKENNSYFVKCKYENKDGNIQVWGFGR